MDIETAHIEGKSGFEKVLAALVGLTALMAALLGTLQQHSGKQEERALVLASRMSVRVFETTAGSGAFSSFQSDTVRDVSSRMLEAVARGQVALEDPVARAASFAVADANYRAKEALEAVAAAMGTPPPAESGVHPHTRATLAASEEEMKAISREQGHQIDRATRYGTRGTRSVLALSFLAVAAVLLALAGVLGRGRAGNIALAAAVLLLVGSAVGGGSALLV